jgi:peroxiredoxin
MASRRRPKSPERQVANGLHSVENRATWPSDAELLRAGILDGALNARDLAPAFALRDGSRNLIKLPDLLRAGPVLVKFYPGEWCQQCVSDLSALAGIHSKIKRLGAGVIAISPKVSARHALASAITKRSFPLLTDIGSKVAKAFGLACALTSGVYINQRTLRCAFPAPDAEEGLLSFPGTFLIDRACHIVFSHVALDHARRVETRGILSVLESFRHDPSPTLT